MTHPFEQQGLGKAPFKCVGVTENVFTMPDGSSKAGGACDYCGTGIRWEFWIKGVEGKFKVGCDCVAKTGWSVDGFEKVRAEHTRARRQAGAQSRKVAREERFAAERAERRAEKLEATAAWREYNAVLVAQLRGYTGENQFIRDAASALAQWGSLTERHASAVESSFAAIERQAAARVTSTHVGTVGQRVKAALRVDACIAIGTTQFYPYQTRYLVKLSDEAGNVLVWFTTAGERPFNEYEAASFTVKGHDERDGVKQTLVQRVSFK